MMSDSTESHARLGERTSHNRVIPDAVARSRNGSRSGCDSPGARHLRAMPGRACEESCGRVTPAHQAWHEAGLHGAAAAAPRVARTSPPRRSPGFQRTAGNRNGEPHGTKSRADCVFSMPHLALPGVRLPRAARTQGHAPCSIRATLRSRSSDRTELNDCRLTPGPARSASCCTFRCPR